MHSGQRTRLLCEQVNARNCRDRRKRLAAEPQGTDGGQVFFCTQLAGRVPPEGNRCVLGRHAAAIIGNPQIGDPAVLDLYGNLGRTGVNGVFHQLLGDRGRPLHHLARRNQVGQMVG